MTNKPMVSVPRELAWRLAHATGSKELHALLAAPAEDVRTVVDEPVAFELLFNGEQVDVAGKRGFPPASLETYFQHGYTSGRLYRHPQRPVVMPKRRTADSPEINQNGHLWWREEKAADFNACLDDFDRLNPQ